MLVGNSLPEYVITRLAVWGLRLVAPASIAYSALIFLQPGHRLLQTQCLVPVHIWMFGEAAFFLGVYLPTKAYLQRAATHPPPPSQPERQKLFQRVVANVSEPELYLSKWFMNAKIEDIKRDNLREFFAWSLMNAPCESISHEEDAELDTYIDQLERDFGRRFARGMGPAKSLTGTLDPVPMQHRPLLWYGIVLFVDVFSSCRLWYRGYSLYRQPGVGPLTMLPQRWHAVFPANVSRSSQMSYWHRKHTSRSRLPILFIHGIGIGIFAYVDFLNSLAAESNATRGEDDNGQVGIIALELMSISSRICPPAPETSRMRHEIHKILAEHGWTDFVLASHSYGTAVASNMLQHQLFEQRIKATVLMDPICFCLHLPDVAYNFTRRQPTEANERMLYYFASQDMMISETLARHFFWSEYILWKEDIPDLPMTVTLSGRDLIVPKAAVWRYLTGSEIRDISSDLGELGQHTRQVEQGPLRVLCFDELDHAGLFASKGVCRGIAHIAMEYSRMARSLRRVAL